MKKTYTRPEIELVEYVSESVIMAGDADISVVTYDNDVAWNNAWNTLLGSSATSSWLD